MCNGNASQAWYEKEWTSVMFSAQDFGAQQLRRMMGVLVSFVRGLEPIEYIDRCFLPQQMTLLPAPAESLCLESAQFANWNSDWRGAAGVDSSLSSAGMRRIQEGILAVAPEPWSTFVA